MRRLTLPNAGLYPLRTLAAAGVIYGGASVLHGSGFLAVFVAGILVGDERAPYKEEVERFFTSLASLAEIVVFVALGLTIELTEPLGRRVGRRRRPRDRRRARRAPARRRRASPVPTRLRIGERLFVMWGGLKGAVPIFLAAFAILAGVDGRAAALRHRLRRRRAVGRRSGVDASRSRRRSRACRCALVEQRPLGVDQYE